MKLVSSADTGGCGVWMLEEIYRRLGVADGTVVWTHLNNAGFRVRLVEWYIRLIVIRKLVLGLYYASCATIGSYLCLQFPCASLGCFVVVVVLYSRSEVR